LSDAMAFGDHVGNTGFVAIISTCVCLRRCSKTITLLRHLQFTKRSGMGEFCLGISFGLTWLRGKFCLSIAHPFPMLFAVNMAY